MKTWDQFWKDYKTSKAEKYYINLRDKIIRKAASKINKEKNLNIYPKLLYLLFSQER